MATIGTIKNLVSCGSGDVLGTGNLGCAPFFKKVVSAWLLPQGTEFDDAETLNLTYVQQLQAEGKIIVLNGIQAFTDNTGDDVTEELEGGTEVYIRGAKYKFAMDFINGLAFHAALHSLSSYNSYDVVLVDREGNMFGTTSNTGKLKGFTVGMLQASKLKFGDDTTQQREQIMMQLLNRNEVDKNYIYIDNGQLEDGFDPTAVDGINEVVLSYRAAPANTDTTLQIKAVRKQDGKPVEGLVFGDFRFIENGTTSNPTGATEPTPGNYDLTVAALATNDVITLELYDTGNNNVVLNKTNVLYKSNTLAATVV